MIKIKQNIFDTLTMWKKVRVTSFVEYSNKFSAAKLLRN